MKKYRIIIISLLVFLFGVTAGYFIEELTTDKNIESVAEAKEVQPKVTDDTTVKEVQKPSMLLFHSRNCS